MTLARPAIHTAAVALATAVVLVTVGCGGTNAASRPPAGGPPPTTTATSTRPATAGPVPVELRVHRLTVALPRPLSDMVVFADGRALLVAGGLTAGDTSTTAVTRIDLATGQVVPAGRLADPVHDAAGLVAGGADLVLGGGTASSVAAVQAVRPGGTGWIAASLPEPRSDLVAATTDGFGYVLGGYTGGRMLSDVLRTSDGHAFTRFASLPVPVRYPALAASGGYLWLLGGMTGDGHATDAIQRIDTGTGAATIAGHLPRPLSHAAGFALDGQVFLAGGRLDSGAVSDQILRIKTGTTGTTGTTDTTGTTGTTATLAATLPAGLSDSGVAILGGTAYLVGGESPRTTGGIIEIDVVAG